MSVLSVIEKYFVFDWQKKTKKKLEILILSVGRIKPYKFRTKPCG